MKRKGSYVRKSGKRRRVGRRVTRAYATARRWSVNRSRMSRVVHAFSRWCTQGTEGSLQGTFTMSCPTKETSINPVIRFDYLPSYTEFTSLYDQYKITTAVFYIQLVNNPDAGNILNSTTAGNNSSNWYPKLWYVRDYDDSTSMTLDQIRQYSTAKCVVLRPNKTFRIATKPAVLMQAYDTAVSTAYIPKHNQWIDAGNYSTPLYGIKFILDTIDLTPGAPAPYKVRFDTKYYFMCKTPR